MAAQAGTLGRNTDFLKLWTGFTIAVVGRAQLVAANSRLQGSSAVAQVAGPSAGGLLVQALTAPAAMLFDALGFLASAGFLLSIRARETVRPREAGRSLRREIGEGL